jgi:redox-sensitive bicupin YhaK (pirin superfamily)
MSGPAGVQGQCVPGDGTVAAIVEPRHRDLGGFGVERILPAVGRRHLGPFVFFDHMGSADFHFAPGTGMDVRPHPHICLATVTYLFDGAVVHRDTLGSVQTIRPGDINWMVAGRGIAHSERTSPEDRTTGIAAHGLQLWCALPTEQEETHPSFDHWPAAKLPVLQDAGKTARILAGTAWGVTAPTRVLSPTFYVDVQLAAGGSIDVPANYSERGVFVVEGAVQLGAHSLTPGPIIVLEPNASVTLRADRPARVIMLGGESVGERHIWWNFVASSRERIEAAKADWTAGKFGLIPGDDQEFIPLPEQ